MAKKSARRMARAAREEAAAQGVTPDKSTQPAKTTRSKRSSDSSDSKGLGGKVTELKEFFDESLVEIKKVTWPSRKETISTSIAVVVLVLVMSLFLGVVDLGLTKLVELILS